MSVLILLRHGESTWNKKGLWTGFKDVPLSKKGREEARSAAKELVNVSIDATFTSPLKRAKETLQEIILVLFPNPPYPPNTQDSALNERDYGAFTGKNKWEVKRQVGENTFRKIRRGWNYPIPRGETLKDVYDRVVPHYKSRILPLLRSGKNVLVVAHGNSIRALVKFLEHLTDQAIEGIELGTGEIYLYDIDKKGDVKGKEVRLSGVAP